jgi:serine/threonine-protein kinase
VPEGKIYNQNPSGGIQVAKGSTITIAVSKGPKLVAVPDVIGLPEADAKAKLEAEGFKVEIVPETTNGSGNVVLQSPSGGTKVQRGSTVTITVDRPAPPATP